MKIAFDIDDTKVDFIGKLILWHNEKYETNLKKKDFHSYRFALVWGGDDEEANRKIGEFYQSKYFKELLPIPGAQEGIAFLKNKGHTLFSVTGRSKSLIDKTAVLIEKHFPNNFSSIHHANTWGSSGEKIRKSEICKRLGVEVIVEDDVMHILDCASVGIKVLVFDQPWNQVVLPPNAIRVYTYDGIIGRISQK